MTAPLLKPPNQVPLYLRQQTVCGACCMHRPLTPVNLIFSASSCTGKSRFLSASSTSSPGPLSFLCTPHQLLRPHHRPRVSATAFLSLLRNCLGSRYVLFWGLGVLGPFAGRRACQLVQHSSPRWAYRRPFTLGLWLCSGFQDALLIEGRWSVRYTELFRPTISYQPALRGPI